MFSPPDPSQHPGLEIAALRAERHVSDGRLSVYGVADSKVHAIERGDADIPLDDPKMLAGIASALRVEVRYLIGRAHDRYLKRESKTAAEREATAIQRNREERAAHRSKAAIVATKARRNGVTIGG